MNILLVSATESEIKPVMNILDKIIEKHSFLRKGRFSGHEISVLVTGIGMTNTAMLLSPVLAQNKYDIAIQAGIAGSYSKQYNLGSVVEIIQENYADLGAEGNEDMLLDLQALGFPSFTDTHKNPYFNAFQNPDCSEFDIPKTISNTVNLCSGTNATIQKRLKHFPADMENMEGAAFFQTCMLYQQRFYAFRAVSNHVEPRNISQWNIPLAVKKLSDFIEYLLCNSVF